MTLGRTIRLYLADGHPAGLIIAEILVSWTGKVLSFPRGLLPQVLKTRPEIGKTGVYFLVGADPDNVFRSIVYVGESDDVRQRLISHDKDENKSFFEQVVLIVSKDENLTKGHVRYLEARLIEIIKQNGQAQLKNGNLGQPVNLPESEQADMESYLQQIRVVLPVLGLPFLQEPPKRSVVINVPTAELKITGHAPEVVTGDEGTTFELTYMNGAITAEAFEAEGQFVVKAGSYVRNPELAVPSANAAYRQRVKNALEHEILKPLEGNPEVYYLVWDMAFPSPSGASDFVCGARTNGRQYWKVKVSNQSYGEWRDSLLAEAAIEASEKQEVLI